MAKADSDTPTTDSQSDRSKAIDKAKYAAQRTLIDENKDRYNDLVQSTLAEQGYEWNPPLTAEQRAAQQMKDLLAQFPTLADQVKSS